MNDLTAAREAALGVLEQVQRWARMLTGMRNPYVDGIGEATLPARPTLDDLQRLRSACKQASEAVTDALVVELAGLTFPSGVRAGQSYFASAHELAASIANAMDDYLGVVLDEDHLQWARRDPAEPASAGNDPNAASQDLVQRLWADDPVYFRQLLWDMLSMAKTIGVARARMLVDCEFAQARRNREWMEARRPASPRAEVADQKKARRPNLNPFSPSTRPNVLRLLAAAVAHWKRPRQKLKKTALYVGAKLKGQSRQRAVLAATTLGFMTDDFRVTPEGVRLLDECKS